MLLFFGISLVIAFGYLLSILLVTEMRPPERLGTSFLLGFGVFTLLMFCYSTLGVKITLESTLLALAVCLSILFICLKLFKRKIFMDLLGIVQSFLTLSRLEKIIILIITMFALLSLVISTYFPVNVWDAIALYDFRAKIITQQGFYIQIAKNFPYFGGYPLFTSLSHTLVYLFGGINPQFLYSFIYFSLVLIFYSTLREFVNRKISLITSLLLVTTPVIFDHSTFAYTNLPYTTFLVTGSIYLYIWLVKNKPVGYLILSALFIGLSTWTRVAEPFWVINILVLVLLSIYRFKKYLLSTLIYTFTFLLIKEPWSLVNNYQLANSGASKASFVTAELSSYTAKLLGTPFDLTRIGEVAVFIYKHVIVSWYPLLFLFLICVFINFKDFFKKVNIFFLGAMLLHFSLLFYATYVFSFNFPEWTDIPDSTKRMAMFFIPPMIFYIGLNLGRLDIHASKKNIKKA
jgi:4-amino-4-deoxy-L-arabinose transferase-like glycosyltransferase